MLHVLYLLFGGGELRLGVVKLCLCRIKLFFAGGKLLFGLCKLGHHLLFGLFVLRPALCYLLRCVFKLFSRLVKLGLTGVYLSIAAVKLRLGIVKLLFIRCKLGIYLGLFGLSRG